MNLKTALLAVTAAAALLGAAIIGVPSSSDRASTSIQTGIQTGMQTGMQTRPTPQ